MRLLGQSPGRATSKHCSAYHSVPDVAKHQLFLTAINFSRSSTTPGKATMPLRPAVCSCLPLLMMFSSNSLAF